MSEVKVNKLSPRTNCGTVTLGDSGDTFTIPSGVTITNNGTQTGFGREGSVDWQTSIKTADFTAVSGEGYFVNTTSSAVTVTLPSSPSAGAIVAVKDYANTADSNQITIGRNGSNIDGTAGDPIIANEGGSIVLVYADATKGWLVVEAAQKSDIGFPAYISATGGTITTVCTNFKVHTFTGPGTFTVCSVGNSSGSNTVDYMVVGGGGAGGGKHIGGGGGAGGWRASSGTASGSYTAGPGPLTSPVSAIPVSAQGYPITVGGGGTGNNQSGATDSTSGNPSVFSTITSTGGGFGKQDQTNPSNPGTGSPGGSGGGGNGGQSNTPNNNVAGNGNTPSVTPPQGNNGGTGFATNAAGGGGGATEAGQNGTAPIGGRGGAGATSHITGSPVAYAGGGGGGVYKPQSPTAGAASPCGTGGAGVADCAPGGAGTTNRGGGGGGVDSRNTTNAGGAGGSGVVIIRYKFQ